MGRKRSPVLYESEQGRAAVAAIVRHALSCHDPECDECQRWREVVDGGPSSVVLAGVDVAAAAEAGAKLDTMARDVIRAIAAARTQPTMTMRRAAVEDALRAMATLLGEELPTPTKFSR